MVGHKVQLQPCQGGPSREEHLDHIKYVLPADRYINAVPDYEQFGHKTNLRMNPKNIPDLKWNMTDELHTMNIGAVLKTQHEGTSEDREVSEIVDINTMYINICSYIKCKIDHNTYTTNTIKHPRVNSTLTYDILLKTIVKLACKYLLII